MNEWANGRTRMKGRVWDNANVGEATGARDGRETDRGATRRET